MGQAFISECAGHFKQVKEVDAFGKPLASADAANFESSDLSYFEEKGFDKLLRAMLKQSLKDIATDQESPDAPAEISASARWPRSPAGLATISFLMPSVSSDLIVAKMYANPKAMLDAFEKADLVGSSNETEGIQMHAAGSQTDVDEPEWETGSMDAHDGQGAP